MVVSGTRPLRVVIDARMPDGSGGVQQWVIGLANAFSRLTDGSEEYRFLVAPGEGAWLAPYIGGPCSLLPAAPAPGDPIEQVASEVPTPERRGGPAARLLRIARRLRRALRGGRRHPRPRRSPFDRLMHRAGAEVVHFTRPSASRTALPNIYQPWDLQHVHLPEFFSAEVLANREAVYRAFCAQATRIVVASRWVKEDIQHQYEIAPARIAVVNPAPVTEAYVQPSEGEEEAVATRLGLPGRYAFYPAQTWSHKNHERLFEALRRLRDNGVEIPLVCSGRKTDRFELLAGRLAELGLEDVVSFQGFLSPLEVQVVYRRSTMLAFPSLYEGWGLPIIEAFAAGVPVACSNVTSLPALVGTAALVFDPMSVDAIAGAMERLWLDERLRAELARAGRERLHLFDWHRTARTMRAHYRQVAGRRLDDADVALLAAPPAI